jgi:hypothetical protein
MRVLQRAGGGGLDVAPEEPSSPGTGGAAPGGRAAGAV